jgi:galactoside O-acetyltransferase
VYGEAQIPGMENPFDPGFYCTPELRQMGFKSVGEGVSIAKNCTIIGLNNISLGDHVRVDGYSTLIAASGSIRIGRRVHIHSYCQIGGRGGVEIDDFAALASGCIIYSASDDLSGRHMVGGAVPAHCTRPKIAPVRLRRHSVLFARCTVLPGVTVEEGGAACAHSLLSSSVPEWTVVAGSPAVHRINRSRRILALEDLADEVEAIAA